MSEFEKVWRELMAQRAVIVAAMRWYRNSNPSAAQKLKRACARLSKKEPK
jgi:hypothetical protein